MTNRRRRNLGISPSPPPPTPPIVTSDAEETSVEPVKWDEEKEMMFAQAACKRGKERRAQAAAGSSSSVTPAVVRSAAVTSAEGEIPGQNVNLDWDEEVMFVAAALKRGRERRAQAATGFSSSVISVRKNVFRDEEMIAFSVTDDGEEQENGNSDRPVTISRESVITTTPTPTTTATATAASNSPQPLVTSTPLASVNTMSYNEARAAIFRARATGASITLKAIRDFFNNRFNEEELLYEMCVLLGIRPKEGN